MDKVKEKLAAVFVAYMCTVFPLFYHNNYINIMQAKRLAFLFGAGSLVIVAGVIAMIGCLVAKKGRMKIENAYDKRKLAAIAAMLLSWGISWMISVDKEEAFWGNGFKCVGLLVYLLGLFSIVYLAKYLRWNPILSWCFLLGSFCVCLLQILNRWGADPLGMRENLIPEEHGIFISTIGQINYNAALDVLVISVILALFLLCKERFSQIIYGSALLVSYGGAICCCSDSVYISFICIFLLLFIYVLIHPEKWGRFAIEVVLLDSSIFGIWFCNSYVKQTTFWGVSALFFHMKFFWLITLILFLFIFIGTWINRKAPKYWKVFGIFVLLLVPAGCVVSFVDTFYAWQISEELGWASIRLVIWEKAWELLKRAPSLHKLFGYGFNMVNPALYSIGENLLFGQELQDMHNIFFNSLVTSGLVGTMLGVAFMAALLWRLLIRLKTDEKALVGVLVLVAYFAQGMLNGPQILTEPVFMVAFGATASILREKREI